MEIPGRIQVVLYPVSHVRFCIICLLFGLQMIAIQGQAQNQADSTSSEHPDSTYSVHKDSLFFYNGQMILGELLSIDQGRVSFDSDIAGVVSIKYHKIRTISANIHYYRIRTSQMKLFYGTLHQSDKDGMVRVNQGINATEIPIRSIIELERYDQSFMQRISGKVALGYNFTKSSDIGRLNVDLTLRYLAQNFQSTINASSVMTQDEGDFSRDTETITSTNQLNLSYRWIAVGLLSYQRNLELGILRRYQEALLLGYNFITFNNRQLYVGLGVALNQELKTEDENASNQIEIPLVANYTFYQFQKPNIQFSFQENVYFGVTESGRIRNDANLKIDWTVITDFTLGISAYSNYDNQASETASSDFDYGVVLNVGYKW